MRPQRTRAWAHRHPPLAGAPLHIANHLAAHAVVPVGPTLRRSCLRRSMPINPRVSSLRMPENTPPASIAISVAVVTLLFRLFSGPTEPLAPSPNLHQSLPDHLWLSSPLTFSGNLAAAECRCCLAAGHHRAIPRPSLRRQSTSSESN
jgi:hypothetical protein